MSSFLKPNSPNISSHTVPILIVNWNGIDDTKECIDSVLLSKGCIPDIYVWDNASSNGEFDKLKELYKHNKQVKLFNSQTNIGFTKACNLLYTNHLHNTTRPKYLILLNNDTVVTANWLFEMVSKAEVDDLDLTSSCLLDYYNRSQIDNKGHFILSTGEILPFKHGQRQQLGTEEYPSKNIGPCAAAALYKVDMLESIGLFDEFFNTGYEDAELGLRAYLSGYKIGHADKAVVYHKGGAAIKKVFNLEYAVQQQINILYTIFKCYPPLSLLVTTPILILRLLSIVLVTFVFGRWAIAKTVSTSYLRFIKLHLTTALKARSLKHTWILSDWRLMTKFKSTILFDMKRIYNILLFRKDSAIEKY